jgi:hypothetical protein
MEGPRWRARPALHTTGLALLLIPWLLYGGGSGCFTVNRSSGPPSLSCPSTPFLSVADPAVVEYFYNAPGALVNAHSVDWIGDANPGAGVELMGPQSGCFEGGSITGTWDPSSLWDTYHLTAALSLNSPSQPIRVKSVHVRNYGDGVSVEPEVPCVNGSTNPWFYVHGSHVEDIHDDAIESDGLCSAEIADNLFERVYVAFAFKYRASDPNRSGSNNIVTVSGNLIRAHSWPNNYKGRPEHNGFWKWSHGGRGPRVRVRNNVFLAFDPPPPGSTLFPYVTRVSSCEDNQLLFAGSEAEWAQALAGACDDAGDDGQRDGERLLALSHCFTVITKSDTESEVNFLATHWDPLVADWKLSHTADDE